MSRGRKSLEPELIGSNAKLYPKLGDIAILKFAPRKDGFTETPVFADDFADDFDSRWRSAEYSPVRQFSFEVNRAEWHDQGRCDECGTP